MKQFKYTAVDLQKRKVKGIFIAEDEKDLANQLVKQNLYLVSAKPYSGGTPSAFFTTGTGKVALNELTSFCRQFAIMCNAGISVLECLELMKDQPFSAFFRSLLRVIYDDVKGGMMLSDAMKKHGKVFPSFFISMVYVGEASGKLDLVLTSVSEYYEKDAAIKKKVRSSFAYPIMLLIMTIGIVILMMLFVVPTFRETLSGLDVPITGFTKVVYDLSDFFLANWLYLLAGFVVIGIVLFAVGQTQKGTYFYDMLKVYLPGFRNVTVNMATSRFCRAFSLLLSSGMDVAEALDTVSIVIGNREITARFKQAAEEIKHGSRMTDAFTKHKIFPVLMLQMIAVGERTAEMEEVLNRSRAFFDDQVDDSLNALVSLIQPILLIFMGVVVGSLFLAVYSPMISIMTTIG